MQIETRSIYNTTKTDPAYGSIGTPIYLTSNFRFIEPGISTGYDYTRSGNPTRSALESVLADLEGGAKAVAVSSGMAAITTVLAHFDAGIHVIATHDCYGGTARLLKLYEQQKKISLSFVDLNDPLNLVDAITPQTRCLWIETPSNPLLGVVDLAALAQIAHTKNILVCVDNTFLSPCLFRPFEYGADVVVHSTTKWLNGHSDCVGGAVISKTCELGERFQYLANALGTTTGAFDSWLVLRGVKTLAVRMRQHEENAKVIAEFLDSHPAIEEVYYPGLPSHPTHEIAKKQQHGFGGVISFRLRSEAAAHEVLRKVTLFALAESLGGVESLIEHPATMSHFSMGEELRRKARITEDIIRISVGIEDVDDLINDLSKALDAITVTFAQKEELLETV